MKKHEETLKASMDRRLSFLDGLPSCRAAVQYRIAQEEEPVMKKKVSVGVVFALILAVLSVAAVAAGLLLSPRATAVQIADRALEEKYGISAEMQTFFGREEEELEDGSVKVTYYGVDTLGYVLGTYTADVKDGRAEIAWTRDGADTAGGYEADAWGAAQLEQMVKDSQDDAAKQAYMDKALKIAKAHGAVPADEEESGESASGEELYNQIEAEKTAAMNARKLPEEELIRIGREFIISNYGLNEEQIGRLELYTNAVPEDPDLAAMEAEGNGNGWYLMVNGKPCLKVEYLLYQSLTTEQMDNGESLQHGEMDGFYNVFVNVETGEIEEYEYNSGLAGMG